MLCRNFDFMNFLIAVLPQSCAARKKCMNFQSMKAQLLMIPAHYRTLPQLAFEDSSLAAGFEKNDEENSESREMSVDLFEDEGDATPNVRGWRSQR
jgi:hypothetical protein